MTLVIVSQFPDSFIASLGLVYTFGFVILIGSILLTWWIIQTFLLPRELTDTLQADTTQSYKDVEGQIARRKQERNRRCLLSLDGGVTGGLSQIFILCEVAHRIKIDLKLDELPRLCDYFDVIGGVGMGGWLSILVGRLGLTMSQVKEEYIATLKLWRSRDSRRLEQFLKQVVKKYTGDEETLMFERDSTTAHCHTFVGAVTTGDVTYLIKFRSYEVREGPTLNCPIWQVAHAALAYPNTFAPVKIGESLVDQIYVSGEIGWSNPSQEVVKEFEAKWLRQKLACLASIGAGHEGPVQIDAEDVEGTFVLAMEKVATDRERIAQDITYRFHGRQMYFRLNVERGMQQDKKATFGDIETHTRNYMCSPGVTESVNKLVNTLLRATEPPEWSMTSEHFEQTLDEYILETQSCVDKIQSNELKTAAQEVIRILEAIRTATWEEEEWLTLARTIHRHCTSRNLNQPEEHQVTQLWNVIKDYFKELKKIRMKLRSLLKSNPHRVWGLPTHEAFISQSITKLDSCDKMIQECLVSDTHSRISQRDQDKELNRFVKWLSPLEPHLRHNTVRLNRSLGTGCQFLQGPEFQAWCNRTNQECRALFAFGKPGAGKTTSCSAVIDRLRKESEGQLKVGTIYIYCDHADRNSQTGLAMIGALTKQLVWWALSIPTVVLDLFRRRTKEQSVMDKEDAKTIFDLVLGQFDTVYICIDALDECKPESRMQLLQFLKAVDSTSIRLFLTGRNSVEAEVTDILSNLSPKIMSIVAAEEDIRLYLSEKLESDRYPEAMNEIFKDQIVGKLVELSRGLFLPVKLQIQAILEHDTMRERRLALQNTPAGLFDAYATTLKRIKQQSGTRPQRALDILMWIYFAHRTLQVVELQHALAIKPDDTAFDPEGISSEKALVECCLGLVVIEMETSTIRLTHFTLQEYLDRHWKGSDVLPSRHSTIATTCLAYLGFDHKFPPRPEKRYLWGRHVEGLRESRPLIHYVIHNLGHHLKMTNDPALARRCITILNQEPKLRILELCLDDERYTPLHWAAYFGCTSVAELLLETLGPLRRSGATQRERSARSHTMLSGMDVNLMTILGNTPLSVAAANGHEAVVQLLLKAPGVDVNSSNGNSPLSLAAANGHEAVVRLLLRAPRVDVNSSDEDDNTPLFLAAENGHEAVVRLLLSAPGIDIDTHNDDGNTPLFLAAENGHEAVVQLLLNAPGVDVNSSNKRGGTPLFWAAGNGHKAVVQLLLKAPRVDVNSSDEDGDTPLSWAAWNGHKGVVRLLLEAPGVDINSRNKDGSTPLIRAAENGREAVVQLLLMAPRVDVNSRNRRGGTPLLRAAQNGHEAVVQLLLSVPGVNVSPSKKGGSTPLSRAAESGHEAVVRLLLQAPGVDVNSSNKHGNTPLSLAAWRGHKAVVQLLLSAPQVNLNPSNTDNETPLSLAVSLNHQAVVQLLLSVPGVDINPSNGNGDTPLLLAARNGHEAIVQLLLNTSGIDVNSRNTKDRTPLLVAVLLGHQAVVQLLLSAPGVDINLSSKDGDTPLSLAVRKGHEPIVQLLRDALGRTSDKD